MIIINENEQNDQAVPYSNTAFNLRHTINFLFYHQLQKYSLLKQRKWN